MSGERIPRLYDDEADRLRALVFVAALLLLPSLARLLPVAGPAPLGWSGDLQGGRTAEALLLGRRLDLNQADATALEALDGIGPSLARAIVADRARLGPFRSIEDLDRVRGIGPSRIAKLRPWVVVPSSAR